MEANRSLPRVSRLQKPAFLDACKKLGGALQDSAVLEMDFWPQHSRDVFPSLFEDVYEGDYAPAQSVRNKREQKTFRWDDDARECYSCRRRFGLLLRRHHCRECGGAFCIDHSESFAYVARIKQEARVCDGCDKAIRQQQQAQAQRR